MKGTASLAAFPVTTSNKDIKTSASDTWTSSVLLQGNVESIRCNKVGVPTFCPKVIFVNGVVLLLNVYICFYYRYRINTK